MVIFPESDHLVAILALLPSAAYSPSLGFRFLNCKMGMVPWVKLQSSPMGEEGGILQLFPNQSSC